MISFKPLKINFYENPSEGIKILQSLFESEGRNSDYIKSFASVLALKP